MLIKCTRIRRKFDDFHDGRVDEATRVQVENHLAACRRCAEEYTYMCRVVYALRSMPRPKTACASGAEILARAGVLAGAESVSSAAEGNEAGEPTLSSEAGRSTVQLRTRRRVRTAGQLAAAALLIGGLVVTHGVAFFLGDRQVGGESLSATDRALAELGKDELPSIIEGHLDKATKLVSLAEVEPEILPTIVRDDVVRGVRHTADRLQALGRAHPGMKALRPQLERYSEAFAQLLQATNSVDDGNGRAGLLRLRNEVNAFKVHVRNLRKSLAKQRLVVHGLEVAQPQRPDVRIIRRFMVNDSHGVMEMFANADDSVFRSGAIQFVVGAVGAKHPYRKHVSSVQRMLVKHPPGVKIFLHGRRFGANGLEAEIEEKDGKTGFRVEIDSGFFRSGGALDELRALSDAIRAGIGR